MKIGGFGFCTESKEVISTDSFHIEKHFLDDVTASSDWPVEYLETIQI